MLYVVVTRCYWKGKVYDLDQEVDLDPALNPPKHFKLASEIVAPPKSDRIDPMKPQPMSFGRPVIAQGGFAAKLEPSIQEHVDTIAKSVKVKPRGRARK